MLNMPAMVVYVVSSPMSVSHFNSTIFCKWAPDGSDEAMAKCQSEHFLMWQPECITNTTLKLFVKPWSFQFEIITTVLVSSFSIHYNTYVGLCHGSTAGRDMFTLIVRESTLDVRF